MKGIVTCVVVAVAENTLQSRLELFFGLVLNPSLGVTYVKKLMSVFLYILIIYFDDKGKEFFSTSHTTGSIGNTIAK